MITSRAHIDLIARTPGLSLALFCVPLAEQVEPNEEPLCEPETAAQHVNSNRDIVAACFRGSTAVLGSKIRVNGVSDQFERIQLPG